MYIGILPNNINKTDILIFELQFSEHIQALIIQATNIYIVELLIDLCEYVQIYDN